MDLLHEDYFRAARLVETYENLSLGFVDAAIVAIAERMGATRIATLNHRDFAVVQPSNALHFTLLPGEAVRD